MPMYISLFTVLPFRVEIMYNALAVKNSCNLYQRIPGTFEAATYK
jgi:hypothetical protein